MLKRLVWGIAIGLTISHATAKDLAPEEACDFTGVSDGIRRVIDKKSYWEHQVSRYEDFLSSSRLDTRLLILENERLRSSISSEVKSAKIYAKHYGDDIKEAIYKVRIEIVSEISDNVEAIKRERGQQKLFQYCIDYAKAMIER